MEMNWNCNPDRDQDLALDQIPKDLTSILLLNPHNHLRLV